MTFLSSMRGGVLLLATGVLIGVSPVAQSQDSQSQRDQSAAEAAKRNREKKKAETKGSKVITNDDLDKGAFVPGQSGVNIGGPPEAETAPPSPQAVAKAEAADKAAEAEAAKKASGEDAQITKLKEQVAAAERELDLLHRELALDSEAYYSKTDFASDKAGKAKLDDEQLQIGAKQQQVDGLKARLATLEEAKARRKPAPNPAPAPAQNEQPGNPPPPASQP